MASMASERDEERKSLEEKLQQLEELPEQTGGMCLEPISLVNVVEFQSEAREIQIICRKNMPLNFLYYKFKSCD